MRPNVLSARWLAAAVLGAATPFAIAPGSASADVVVITNRTSAMVQFSVAVGSAAGTAQKLDAGDLLPIACRSGEKARVAFMSGGKRRGYALAANSVYFFHRTTDADELDLQEIELLNRVPPRPGDQRAAAAADALPGNEKAPRFAKVTVKILADDDERAVRTVWEERLRKRIALASKLLEKYAGVTLEVVACETWVTDNEKNDFTTTLAEFIEKVKPDPADIAIGFSSQYTLTKGRTHMGGTRGPFASHILVREWSRQVSEPERLEILVHELGHRFGAVHSPEANSVMRPVLGDRQSVASNFRIVFDPLNTLAVNLIGQEIRDRGVRHMHEISGTARDCLVAVYTTLGKAFPEDPAVGQYLMMLGEPPPPRPRPQLTHTATLVDSARVVRDAVVELGDQNRRLPPATATPNGPARVSGDELTSRYVRAAAAAAQTVPDAHRTKAFALGLAVALGDTDMLMSNSLTRDLLPHLETPNDRERRVAVIGMPTMHGRNDLLRHFFLSAAIAAMTSPQIAEAAGILKELQDAQGKSGFSFPDLAADLAGIAFAAQVQRTAEALGRLAASFRTTDFLPTMTDLAEGISYDDFQKQYGSTSDPRFTKELDELRKRVKNLPVYRDGTRAVATEKSAPAKP